MIVYTFESSNMLDLGYISKDFFDENTPLYNKPLISIVQNEDFSIEITLESELTQEEYDYLANLVQNANTEAVVEEEDVDL